VFSRKKITGRESEGAYLLDELIGCKPAARIGLDAGEFSFIPSGNRNRIPSLCFKVPITKATAPSSDVACCKPSK
jgi:hypothetical protein